MSLQIFICLLSEEKTGEIVETQMKFEQFWKSLVFTARKRSWGKVLVSQVFVSLQGREGVGFPACITGHMTGARGSASLVRLLDKTMSHKNAFQ